MQEAVDTDAMRTYLSDRLIGGTDWTIVDLHRRYVRLEPPHAYWAM